MKNPNIQIKEVPNKIFLSELQNRLRENKIKESQLAKILTNNPEEQAEIKA
ncbi:26514_t:CDS:2 [Gigaspora margarita]|uniref:26514_t:CDS:1 n=1 Tax=Gigaspora margarita TaxID=4874 RepID=A0ABN7WAS9_GIGMA|nr:26514_t:CDS:2 [Gigaspora margarita]